MKCTRWSDSAPVVKNRARFIAAASVVATALLATAPSANADSAYAFGLNVVGQIGNGTSGNGTTAAPVSTPVPVSILDNSITVGATGGDHSLVVDNGALYAFGYNNFGQLGNGQSGVIVNALPVPTLVLTSGVTAVTAGYYFSLALQNGGVYFFGGDLSGESGNGVRTNSAIVTPTLINTLSSGVTAISAGQVHALAIKNGALYSWGYNGGGQIGNGVPTPVEQLYVPTPYSVPSLSSGVTSIAAGLYQSLAVKDGHAWGFGNNASGDLAVQNGQTGQGNPAVTYTTPQPVFGLPDGLPVSKVAAGGARTDGNAVTRGVSMALVKGVAYAWGDNTYGELGRGVNSDYTDANPDILPVTDTTGSPIPAFLTNLQVGYLSGYALDADGSLWTWGRNNYGQLGIGNLNDTNQAQKILPPAGKVFTSIDVGSYAEHAIVTLGVAPSKWTPDSSGNWNDSASWSSGVPNAIDAGVYLTNPPITASRTITTTSAVTLGNLSFNSASSYVIQGAGSITINATPYGTATGAVINDYVGDHTVAPALLEFAAASTKLFVSYGSTLTLGSPTGTVVIDSNSSVTETDYGTVAFTSAVSMLSGSTLNLSTPTPINGLTMASNATTTVAPHGYFALNLLTLGSLSLSATSKLDLSNNAAIIHTGDIAALSTALGQGFNGGTWTGFGIDSSSAATSSTHLTALGSVKVTTPMTVGGQSLVASDVLIKYTYYGDADLNGVVNGNDYTLIDSAYTSAGTLTGWQNGDFNYDGHIDGSDYTLIDNAFNRQGGSLAASSASMIASNTSEVGLSGAAVPEPSTLGLIGIGVVAMLRRRRGK